MTLGFSTRGSESSTKARWAGLRAHEKFEARVSDNHVTADKPAVLDSNHVRHHRVRYSIELRDEPSTLRSASEGRKGPP